MPTIATLLHVVSTLYIQDYVQQWKHVRTTVLCGWLYYPMKNTFRGVLAFHLTQHNKEFDDQLEDYLMTLKFLEPFQENRD